MPHQDFEVYSLLSPCQDPIFGFAQNSVSLACEPPPVRVSYCLVVSVFSLFQLRHQMVGSTSVLTKLLKYIHFASFVKTQLPIFAHKKRLALVSSEPPLLAVFRLYWCSVYFACYTVGLEPQRQHCRSISTSRWLSSPVLTDSRKKSASPIGTAAALRSSVQLSRCSRGFPGDTVARGPTVEEYTRDAAVCQ